MLYFNNVQIEGYKYKYKCMTVAYVTVKSKKSIFFITVITWQGWFTYSVKICYLIEQQNQFSNSEFISVEKCQWIWISHFWMAMALMMILGLKTLLYLIV